jgi:hypothetical protein
VSDGFLKSRKSLKSLGKSLAQAEIVLERFYNESWAAYPEKLFSTKANVPTLLLSSNNSLYESYNYG